MNENAMYGTNEMLVDGRRYRLAGGDKTHLVASGVDGDELRPAVDGWRCETAGDWQHSYDLDALMIERWSPRTECGKNWQLMIAGDGPSVSPYGEKAFAPDCKSCLRILASKLDSTVPDDRIRLVSALAVEETMLRGSATIAGVPGDQTDALRRAIRSVFRANGAHCGTRVFNGAVVVWLEDDLPSDREAEVAAEARDAVARISVDEPTMQPQDRVIHWSTWG